jgi:protein-S-isoprenylcysteine O-methyltransferase Ste14
MTAILFIAHLAAVLMAALVIWLMRHELTEKAATGLEWAAPAALAVFVALLLLAVSPGKRFQLWLICVAAGLVIGLGAGLAVKATKDFGYNLVIVDRTWDGIAAASLLFLLALIRFVSSSLLGRQSGGFGVLGGASALVAMYLLGRYLTLHFYTAPRSIHLDLERGRGRPRRAD